MGRFAENKMSHDLPTRELEAGDLLIKQGARAKEVFLIKSGRCEVIVHKPDGSEVKVAERGEGEFIGEMGIKIKADGQYDVKPAPAEPEAASREVADADSKVTTENVASITTLLRVKNKWVGGRRGADVRALTGDEGDRHDAGADAVDPSTTTASTARCRR